MLRWIFLGLSLSGFATSLFMVAEHWTYEESPKQLETLFKQTVSLEKIEQGLDQHISAGELDEARRLLTIAQRFGYSINSAYWQHQIDEQDTWQHRVGKGFEGFTQGFMSGKGSDGYALAGAMTSDFTVVGDVRDLHEQYERQEAGKPVNELIVTLSGVGIGLTALTIGTAGTALPAKAGNSMLKFAGKSGRLSKEFSDLLTQKAKQAFDWQAFTRLAKSDSSLAGIQRAAKQVYNPKATKELAVLAERTNNIRRVSSTADTVKLLKYVDNANDLRRLEKVTKHYGTYTKGILKFVGKAGLRSIKVLKKTFALIMSFIGMIISGLFSVISLFPKIPVKAPMKFSPSQMAK
ncbi:MAG: hypothetical protein ACWA5U_00490 [bacterium]